MQPLYVYRSSKITDIYSSVAQINQQISELAKQIINHPNPIESNYIPLKYFSNTVNKSVAQSFELHLPEKLSIKSKLLQLEK